MGKQHQEWQFGYSGRVQRSRGGKGEAGSVAEGLEALTSPFLKRPGTDRNLLFSFRMKALSLSLWVVGLSTVSASACDGVKEQNVTGQFGGQVILPCYQNGAERVYWQTEVDGELEVVNTFCAGAPSACGKISARYVNRSRFLGDPRKGNFTLRLWALSPRDELTYQCVTQDPILCHSFQITIEAQRSLPRISIPEKRGRTLGEEVMLICTVTGVYPKPQLEWVNTSNNTILPQSQVHTRADQGADGLYNVMSTLRLQPNNTGHIICQTVNTKTGQVTQSDIFTGTGLMGYCWVMDILTAE
ncbi:ICOS ligand-like, partial [Chiloscyllium plagiosum]|uniref:ICOS ligand-like n=1 Tax=Chiloscyllium plagiosum TaxID=36176 RepID=UPI001CB7BCA1